MAEWMWFGVAAAILYGLHQVFTKLASPHIGSGLGALVVESSAVAVVAGYLLYSRLAGKPSQVGTAVGFGYSILTGLCVGIGTIAFFVLFQRGGPLSAVPAILAAGAAIMALAGITLLGEAVSWQRVVGIALSVGALYLLNAGNSK